MGDRLLAARSRIGSLAAWLCAGVMLGSAAWVAAGTIWLAFELRSPGPAVDFWRFLPVIEAHHTGDLELSALLEPHFGHRLFFPKLLYAAEYALFGGRNFFLLCLSLLLQSIVCATFLVATWRAGLAAAEALVLTGAAGLLLFSGSQLENFARPWNLHWFLVHAAALLSLAALIAARSARSDERPAREWLALASVLALGTVASLSMANGLAVWPSLVVLSIALRAPASWTLGLFLAGLAASTLYFDGVGGLGRKAAASLEAAPLLAGWLSRCLGSPLAWHHRAAGLALGAGGALAALAFLTTLVKRRPRLSASEWLWSGTLCFALGSCLLTAAGRAPLGRETWLAPRYQTQVLLFWLSAAGLAIARAGSYRVPVLLGLTTAMLAMLLPAQASEARRVVDFGARVREANAVIAAGLPYRAGYSPILPLGDCAGGDCVVRFRQFLESTQLGVFAERPYASIGKRLPDGPGRTSTCPGAVSEIVALLGNRAEGIVGLRLAGAVASAAEAIVVIDSARSITGIGALSPALPPRWESADGPTRRWVAYSQPPERRKELEVWAKLGTGWCRIAGPFAVGRSGAAR